MAGSLSTMRFGDVDLPESLVSAHTDGRLVLFVGAGASLPAPSNLPTFIELAKRIADDSRVSYTETDLDKPDELLGRIDDGNVDVHLRVRELICREDSRPNELHRAIVDLAVTASACRIVTTNYDRHLSGLLPTGVDEFETPALPPGHDFHGLVYLHGSVRQDPGRLVVTKADFGRAYLSERWAAQFLTKLFGDRSVVFIGYGLNDTPVQYLTRALPSQAELYALTDEPNDPRWQEHGIVPVGYGSHEHLPRLVREWADNARMGMLDHDRRVRSIVSGAPPLSPEDESYLDSVVADPERVGLFTTHARGVEWLRWLSSRPQFKSLFDPSASFGTVEHDLKGWFAKHYAANPEAAGDALQVVATNGGLVHRELWFTLVQSLSRPDRVQSEATDRFIPLLAHTMPPGCNEWLGMLLQEFELPRDKHLFLTLFDRIWEPRLAVDPPDPAHMKVRAGPEEPWLPSIGREWLEPSGANLATDLAPLLDRHLRQFFILTKTVGSSVEVWELKGLHRASIENHEPDWRDCCPDPLIDIARDVLEVLVADASEVAGGYLRAWSEHEWPILRRLAVHGWLRRQDCSADDKLRWLQESDLLLDRLLRPEVMRLLEAALPVASPLSIETTVSRVAAACRGGDDERYTFDLLAWIGKHAPESTAAGSALAELEASRPDWRPREDPDFPTWSALSAEDLTEPLELQDLHDRIRADADAAVTGLINEKDERAGRGVDWTDALDALFSTVVEHSEDGAAVLRVLADEPTGAPDLERDLGEAVLSGWAHARATASLTDEKCTHLAGLLPDVWERGLRRWGDAKTTFGDFGWLESAECHWAGMIAGLWLEAVLAERRIADDGWTGLPDTAKTALEVVLGGDTKASHFAQVVVAARLHLLFQLDEPWSRCNVLPMFDPMVDDCRAERCWEGWLRVGRIDESLLHAGLLGRFVSMAPRVERMDSRHAGARAAYARLTAGICVDTAIDPLEDGWLSELVASSDIETRVAWVQEMTGRLAGLSADAADAHWSKWMRSYWNSRLASIPVAMTPEEASVMAEWPVVLGSNFPEAAELAAESPAPPGHGSRLLYRLAGLDTPKHEKPRPHHLIEHPESTAQLLARLLHNAKTSSDDLWLRHLTEVVARLDKLLDPQRMEPVLNELLRLGFGEFVGWLQSQRDTANDSTPAGSLS